MKKNVILVILLSITMTVSIITVNAADIKNNTGYLTEEAVFEALAVTYNDTNLMSRINEMKTGETDGFSVDGFHAQNFIDYTNDDFGGMYLDDSGQLILCFKDNSESLKYFSDKARVSSRLIDSSKNTVVNSYVVKAVKFSYSALLDAYGIVNRYAEKLTTGKEPTSINECWIDIINNQLVVGLLSSSQSEADKKIILSLVNDDDIIAFVTSNMEEQAKFVSTTIGSTSTISNASGSSTPACLMYSYSKGYSGVITCAHGYSIGDTIFTGTLEIGKTTDRVFSATNDSSFIQLNANTSYTDIHDEISTSVPVINSYITLRGYQSGVKSAKVEETNYSKTIEGVYCTEMIRVNQPLVGGDSGGGAIGGVIDGGRTNCIVAINRASSPSEAYLVKGYYIWNAYI